jgi:hypothetical protein
VLADVVAARPWLVGDKPVAPGGDLLRITTHTCLRHNHRALRRRRIAAGLAVPCHVSSRDCGAVVGASPWLENRAARAGEGSPARACLDGRFVTYEQRCQLTQPDPRTVIDR